MEIIRVGSVPSAKGPSEYFTGSVRVDRLFQPHAPARTSAGHVTFDPGARSAWHTHPLGQTLIITSGCGWVQRDGGPVEEVHPGDVIWFPPGEKHWHGATPTTGMTHIAIQEAVDGKVVDWLDTSATSNTAVQISTGAAMRGRLRTAEVAPHRLASASSPPSRGRSAA